MMNQLRFLKRVSGLLRSWRFYTSSDVDAAHLSQELNFEKLSKSHVVTQLLDAANVSFTKQHDERLANGDAFVCILNDADELLSYGWSTSRIQMPISELGLLLNSGEDETLYDFHTPEQHRNQGYYTCLLSNLAILSRNCWIYAHSKNIPSCKAIERSGFTRKSSIKLLCSGKFSLIDTQGA